MTGPIRRKEVLTWTDVEKLIDVIVPQLEGEFEAMVMVTRGGIVPGGMLAERLDMKEIFLAAVSFPLMDAEHKLLAWPDFLQFPRRELLHDRQVLVVDDVWGSGRTMISVKDGVFGAGGRPSTCVLHFNPYRSLFTKAEPDYYGAVTDAFIVYPWEIDRGPDFATREPAATN